jgi:hypothetical protein
MSDVLPSTALDLSRVQPGGRPDLEDPPVGPSPRVENLIRSTIDEHYRCNRRGIFIFARSPQLEM